MEPGNVNVGTNVPQPQLNQRERPRRKRGLVGRVLGWAVRAVVAFVILSVFMVLLYRFVPPPITLTMVGDALGGHGIDKSWRPLSQIDPNMARAAIAGEDSRFCLHNGFDLQAIETAYARNARGGRIRGGSTISQQTAKNVFLIQGGGYARKALEAYFTVLIENIWGKRRIMEVYLNVAETGIGTYGVDAASRRYFGHDASHLTPDEAGRIAAVLPLPKKRAAIAPRGFTRRHGNAITRRVGVVRNDGLDRCLR
ncbi:monofunctional biosynthetic peptidoglycan transglycosylase [Sphingomonas sp. TF3]|uniref:monofunctional biosynthetic peptidoglycan transglycosylase n=1 Tax=Sphingomonas sp. TF3 TaxID=2495580 RepID=UPI0021B070B4|nr:monofunctional biosynthetic peptidoglycan transglycosylase [Sphingomonas sp. TF3]